jgi:hypothetical protein
MNTFLQLDSQEFEDLQKVVLTASLTEKRERERERGQGGLLTEGEQKGSAGRRRWTPPEREAAGEQRRRRALGIAKNREHWRRLGNNELLARLGLEAGFFKNARWAHRTVYSSCPVHTGQRTVTVR